MKKSFIDDNKSIHSQNKEKKNNNVIFPSLIDKTPKYHKNKESMNSSKNKLDEEEDLNESNLKDINKMMRKIQLTQNLSLD